MNTTLRRVAALLSSLLLASAVSAQTYPSKAVTLLVPYPAGGLSDVIARTVNNTLSKQLGQPVIARLCGEIRYPCNIVVRDGRSIVYVAKVTPPTWWRPQDMPVIASSSL